MRTVPLVRIGPLFLLLAAGWTGPARAAGPGAPSDELARRVHEGDAAMGDALRLAAGTGGVFAPVCADGERLYGIDVSKWQGSIDWSAMAADGVVFAFVRASDGTGYIDEYFDYNWAEAKANGITVGAYQFFRPNQDPIAQADVLLDMMGPLQPGDLPPVIDVEVTGGLGGAAIANAVQAWLDHVEAATGRKPIIYTSPGFWDGSVGSNAFGDYPLWIAHWGVECPSMPSGWTDWVFHQFSDSGNVGGKSPVDEDWFNGSPADLADFAVGMAVCGDQMCTSGETPDNCPDDCPPCGIVPPEGAIVDNGDACYELYGPEQYWREEAAGYGGSLQWTAATDFPEPSNFAVVRLHFAQAGSYVARAYIEPAYAQSKMTVYRIRAGGQEFDVPVDQSTASGWVELGTFEFAAGGDQWIRLDDNTGEPNDATIQIVFDAFEVAPPAGGTTGATTGGGTSTTSGTSGGTTTVGTTGSSATEGGTDGSTAGSGPGLPQDYGDDDEGCGCRAHGRAPAGLVGMLALAGLGRRRRRQVPKSRSRASK
ncbi:MAG: hypothetical protein D6705_07435 [Deltaproteobacteria bacterium]|nr:MAG: hypothetical protein D6705_07435 [Deltaproteobacteria bacterium]